MTPRELSLLAEQHFDESKEHYEFIALAVQVGYINANSKKKVEMFPKVQNKVGQVSKEKKAEDLSFLEDRFKRER